MYFSLETFPVVAFSPQQTCFFSLGWTWKNHLEFLPWSVTFFLSHQTIIGATLRLSTPDNRYINSLRSAHPSSAWQNVLRVTVPLTARKSSPEFQSIGVCYFAPTLDVPQGAAGCVKKTPHRTVVSSKSIFCEIRVTKITAIYFPLIAKHISVLLQILNCIHFHHGNNTQSLICIWSSTSLQNLRTGFHVT